MPQDKKLTVVEKTGSVGRFICALGYALADLVKNGVYRRHVDLKHYSVLLRIAETHYGGKVVIGIPGAGVNLKVGEEIIIFGKDICRVAMLESIQLDGASVAEASGDGAREMGIGLRKAPKCGELCRFAVPAYGSAEPRLDFAEAVPSMKDKLILT